MFDTERLGYEKMKKVLPIFGYNMTKTLLYRTIGINKERAIEEFCTFFGKDFPAKQVFIKRRELVNIHINKYGVPMKVGLIDLLKYLKSCSITIIVATSSYRKTAFPLLSMANIIDKIDYVIYGDDIVNSKPNPEIFLMALKKSHTSSEHAIVLEDSQVGIISAAKAGIRPIMVPDIYPPNEFTKKLIFKELPDLIAVKNFFVKNI